MYVCMYVCMCIYIYIYVYIYIYIYIIVNRLLALSLSCFVYLLLLLLLLLVLLILLVLLLMICLTSRCHAFCARVVWCYARSAGHTGLIGLYSQFFACSSPRVDRCSNPLSWDPLISTYVIQYMSMYRHVL